MRCYLILPILLATACAKEKPPDVERVMAQCKVNAAAAGMTVNGDVEQPKADYVVNCMRAAGFDIVRHSPECGPPDYNLGHASCYATHDPYRRLDEDMLDQLARNSSN
jgi:hypothetical protein